jgi:predicted outer membrane repeat protein
MFFSSWLRNRNRHGYPHKRPTFRPTLETLEDRWVPSTLTVTNTLDSGAGSLRAEISAAGSGDTINFALPPPPPGQTTQTITLTSGELLIKKNLTIAGPGADKLTISGNHASRVFELGLSGKNKPHLVQPQVSLSGMTISNGNDRTGGAIVNQGILTISNSILSSNSALQGGAIQNAGTLTVNGCTLTGNSASYAGLGGAIQNLGTLTVSPSSVSPSLITNNSASYGGGIWNDGTATLNATTLSGNSVSYSGGAADGGGIDNTGYGTLTLNGCTLSGNSAFKGGGIYTDGTTLNLSGCTLTDNSAAYEGGGLFIAFGATATVSGSVVGKATVNGTALPGNSAPQGGGIYVELGATATVSGSKVIGNSATEFGGGIYVDSPTPLNPGYTATLTVENSSTITGNSAPAGSGPDVYNLGTLYADSTSINSLGSLNGNNPILIP